MHCSKLYMQVPQHQDDPPLLVAQVKALPGCITSSKNKKTKLAYFTESIANRTVKLFQQLDAVSFRKLLVDWTSLEAAMMEQDGGPR